jgi:hypothetical protein
LAVAANAPSATDVELSLFGPGFGEAVAIHLGDGQWLLVDSCEDAAGQPAALAYLESIGVDLKKHVAYVVISHWHDDHVRGMGEVVRRCSKAPVAFSAALSATEFLTLMSVAEKRAVADYSGVTEMSDVYSFLKSKRRIPKRATADTRLFQSSRTDLVSSEVWSLSPSSGEVDRGEARFAQLLLAQESGEAEWVDPTDLNQLSVVLWVRVGHVRILLGSDLTKTRNGWHAICSSTTRPDEKSVVFKIPHHGSSNAQLQNVWDDMLDDAPYAVMTPFNRGRAVPSTAEAAWIKARTPHAWITSEHSTLTGLNPVVARVLEEASTWATPANPAIGHVRLRRPALGDGAWSLAASPPARAL